MKTGTNLYQRREPAINHDFTGTRSSDSGEQLENRTLARSVVTDDAESFTSACVETYLFQCPKIFFPFSCREQFPQQGAVGSIRLSANAILLRNLLQL